MRTYYRHAKTGDRGYLSEDGTEMIYDRPNDDLRVPFLKDQWNVDKFEHPLTRSQKTQVAHAADKVLVRLLGASTVNNKDWASLTDRQRIAWIKKGPQKGIRKDLYAAVMKVMEQLGDGG